MNESRKTLIKIILIFILVSSLLSGNLFALIVSAMALYGLATDDMGLLKMVLVPFIIEIGLLILITLGIFLTFIIVLVTVDDNDTKLIFSVVLCIIFVIFLVIIAFQVMVIVIINRFISDTNESKKIANSSNTQNYIQNTNIYTNEPQPPELPPRNPNEGGISSNYPMPQPPVNAASVYPVLPQADNYEELPPPYVENPNIKVSDAKS